MMNSHPDGEFQFEANNLAETNRLAAALADELQAGDIICLHGPLGAGKTRFVQGVTQALGVTRSWVNSPTFTLVQEYDARVPISHVDAYRLRDSDEFLELGGEEILNGEQAVFIEWAERITEILPRDRIDIVIEVTGREARRFHVKGTGFGKAKVASIQKQLR